MSSKRGTWLRASYLALLAALLIALSGLGSAATGSELKSSRGESTLEVRLTGGGQDGHLG
jgi:hypothetical protein